MSEVNGKSPFNVLGTEAKHQVSSWQLYSDRACSQESAIILDFRTCLLVASAG